MKTREGGYVEGTRQRTWQWNRPIAVAPPPPTTTAANEVPTPAHQWAHATVRGKEPLSRELLVNERLVNERRARLARAVSPPNGVCV